MNERPAPTPKVQQLRRLARAALWLIGPALLISFLASVDLGLLWETLRGARLALVGAALLLAAPFFVLKAARWRLILRALGITLPYRDALALTCIGQYAGTVTPGQAGDAVRAWYLQRRGEPLASGLTSVVLDRLFDLWLTLLAGALGLALLSGSAAARPGYAALLAVGGIGLGAMGVVLLGDLHIARRLRGVMARLLPQKARALIAQRMPAQPQLTLGQLMLLGLVSAAALSWTYARIYLLFLALDTPIPVGPFITVVALLALLGPASPGGVGTRDALLILVLETALGLSRELALARAIALSALILLLNLANIAIGLLTSLWWRRTSAAIES